MQRIYDVCGWRFQNFTFAFQSSFSILQQVSGIAVSRRPMGRVFRKPPPSCWGQLCYSLWFSSLTPWTESWLWGSAVSLKHIPHKTPDYVQLLPKKLPRANDEPFPLIYSTSPPLGLFRKALTEWGTADQHLHPRPAGGAHSSVVWKFISRTNPAHTKTIVIIFPQKIQASPFVTYPFVA